MKNLRLFFCCISFTCVCMNCGQLEEERTEGFYGTADTAVTDMYAADTAMSMSPELPSDEATTSARLRPGPQHDEPVYNRSAEQVFDACYNFFRREGYSFERVNQESFILRTTCRERGTERIGGQAYNVSLGYELLVVQSRSASNTSFFTLNPLFYSWKRGQSPKRAEINEFPQAKREFTRIKNLIRDVVDRR